MGQAPPENEAVTAQRDAAPGTYDAPTGWECLDKHPVYRDVFHAPEGREVKLTWCKTYEHEDTGERRHDITGRGSTTFVFHDEWPDDDILEVDGIEYKPFSVVA